MGVRFPPGALLENDCDTRFAYVIERETTPSGLLSYHWHMTAQINMGRGKYLSKSIDQNIFSERNFHGVKGVIFIREKILVYRRDIRTTSFPLCVDLPGGGKENNESPLATFKRELMEEFGIKINSTDVVYAKKYISVMDPMKESYFIVTKPLDIKEDDIVLGDEGLEFMLMDPGEYLKLSDGIKRQQNKVAEYLDAIK